ncbi:hypothetical protein GCM10010172_65650 [Paractinoplanes ferrugineus]|uniref:Protein kinase domain-containing protein n=1 Tax=Paractinoplanes ferrugineus TaxID=113564 RepID=A0A919J424_9ACTN|nr:protein kinase [Actinoplanes ferrugineus]GIE13274.1 hypothetical protein Afe05nite_51140 [Actinoplanes ferrugineus]
MSDLDLDLDLPAAHFARFLGTRGLPVNRTLAFAGLSTLVVVDAAALPDAKDDLAVVKGLSGYYHVIEHTPPELQPGVYGYYWYKRYGPEQHEIWRTAFAFEFGTLTRLSGDPNWVEVWSGDMHAEVPYYVMRHYPRGSLAAHGAAQGWQFPAGFLMRTVTDIATGLATLHGLGVAHRDLNAENVLLTDDGGAVVGDLGCARDLHAARSGPQRKPDEFHWPPEYAEAYDRAGVEADVYSFGVILHQMATGRAPRHGAPPCAGRAASRGLPLELGALADACLEYLPENRPRSMVDVTRVLHTL